jgi:hypothetical protein
MASLAGVEILLKHGVTDLNFGDVGSMLGKTLELVTKLASQLDEQAKKAGAVKPPFDLKAEKDKKAAEEAAGFFNAFKTAFANWVDENPNRAFHSAPLAKEISSFVTEEINFARRKAERNLAPSKRSDAADIVRSDAEILIGFADMLWSSTPGLLAEYKRGELPETVKAVKDKKGSDQLVTPKLPKKVGASGGVPTRGRTAAGYRVVWSLPEQSFPLGTDLADIVRAVWPGPERASKKINDLYKPFDELGISQLKDGQTLTAELNGKQVTVTCVAIKPDDSEEESKPAEEAS